MGNRRRRLKKNAKNEIADDLRPAYDMQQLLKGGIRGKYAKRYQAGTNVVLLDPDVAEAFASDEEAINSALRLVIQMTKIPLGKKHKTTRV